MNSNGYCPHGGHGPLVMYYFDGNINSNHSENEKQFLSYVVDCIWTCFLFKK